MTIPQNTAQFEAINKLVNQLGATFTVEHSHTSKSITLPVPTITMPGLTFMLRDNFHDLHLYVRSDEVLNLPLSFFYTPQTFQWYQGKILSKRAYSFADWTDEEMNDPRVLRVLRKNGNGWSEVSGDAKDRWAARASSTDWYSRDWSRGKLIHVGPVPFTDATVFYETGHAYAQGIPHTAKPYYGPCREFVNEVNGWDELTRLCLGIAEHVSTNKGAQ